MEKREVIKILLEIHDRLEKEHNDLPGWFGLDAFPRKRHGEIMACSRVIGEIRKRIGALENEE